MKGVDLIKGTTLSLACLGLVLPHPAVYAGLRRTTRPSDSLVASPACRGKSKSRIAASDSICGSSAPLS